MSSRLHFLKLESFGFQFFVGDIVSGVGFRPFWPRLPGPGCQAHNFWTQVFIGNWAII